MKYWLIGISIISSLNVFACASGKQYCVNDNVISDSGHEGRIEAIKSNLEVIVRFDEINRIITYPVNRLAKTKGCTWNKDLCVNDVVISDSGAKGIVKGVLINNEVMVLFEGHKGYKQWPTSRLAPTNGCTHDDFCVGEVVVSDEGFEGIIQAIYPDQELTVLFEGHSGYKKWPTNRLVIKDTTK